jgi:FkbM family methyltransferase
MIKNTSNVKVKSKFLYFVNKYPRFKKIYYFYNIYIRNFKFLLNGSQFGEGKIIVDYFKDGYKGNFVDLGCFHPTRHNNTFDLYKNGWRGINVDLDPLTIELFNFCRSKDININCGVSDKESIATYYSNGELSPLNTLEKNHLLFLNKNFNINNQDFKRKKTKTKTLANILKKNKFYKIDFLNIDLEGHELRVIKKFNFALYSINIICLEVLNHNVESIKNNQEIQKILKKNNFMLSKKIGVNYFYKNKNFLINNE